MAEMGLAATSAFSERFSCADAAFSAEVCGDYTLASLAAFKGKGADVRARMHTAYGISLPSNAERVARDGIAALWAGPNQWLVSAARGDGNRDLEAELNPLVAGCGAVTDMSDSRAIVRLSGGRVRDVLAKGLPIDLHPRAFQPGRVAITHAAHIGVMIWQLDAKPTYEIAVARSFADSFASWLSHAAAEFTGR